MWCYKPLDVVGYLSLDIYGVYKSRDVMCIYLYLHRNNPLAMIGRKTISTVRYG